MTKIFEVVGGENITNDFKYFQKTSRDTYFSNIIHASKGFQGIKKLKAENRKEPDLVLIRKPR